MTNDDLVLDMNLQTDFQHVFDLLNEYADRYKAVLTRYLEQHDRKASGQLIRNISTNVKIGHLVYTVTLQCADYLYWVSEGRKPSKKFPPIDKIQKWIEIKPIIPRPMENGKLPTTRQLAFLIGRKIKNEGYKGTYDIELTTDEVNAHYLPLLQEALQMDFDTYYSIKVLNHIGKSLKKIGFN